MARSKRVVAERGEEIAKRYAGGESLPGLAREFELGVSTVADVVRRHGVQVRTHNAQQKVSRTTIAAHGPEIARRYMEGEDGVALAREYGLAHGSVLRLVRKSGGTVRPRGGNLGRFGEESASWRGGTYVRPDGYRVVAVQPDDPMVVMAHQRRPGNTAYVPEHRLVMARTIKRPLLPTETVHHINGDRLDNRIENLQLRTGNHGKGVHMRCRDCGSQNVAAVEL